jgi:hypothetical protein
MVSDRTTAVTGVAAIDCPFQTSVNGNSGSPLCSAEIEHNLHREYHRHPSHLITFRRKMFVRAAIGPATPIATPMLLVASHMSHPTPEPALALSRAAIASERTDVLPFVFCSMLFFPKWC